MFINSLIKICFVTSSQRSNWYKRSIRQLENQKISILHLLLTKLIQPNNIKISNSSFLRVFCQIRIRLPLNLVLKERRNIFKVIVPPFLMFPLGKTQLQITVAINTTCNEYIMFIHKRNYLQISILRGSPTDLSKLRPIPIC